MGWAAGDCASNRGDRDWERVAGARSTGRGMVGFATIGTTRQSAWGSSVTLGIGTSTLGGGTATLGWWVVMRAVGFALILFRCFFATAADCFAAAILVNNSLTFVNASAVSLPAGMLPLRAVVSCWAAATTWDSDETAGFVIYWCLKNTVLLILIVRVLVTYTWKQRWCSIDVPRLKPGSKRVSHDSRSSDFTWVWTAHPIGANNFRI